MKAGVKYTITGEQIRQMIADYTNAGGEVLTASEGVLGWGTLLFSSTTNKKLPEFVVQERYLNDWSSEHICTKYLHGIPQKYRTMYEQFTNN